MLNYIVRRLALFVPMAAGMVVVTFSLLLLIPGDPAAVLLGQAAMRRDAMKIALRGGERVDIERVESAARQALGDEAFDRAFRAGHTADADDAIRRAREGGPALAGPPS